MTSSSYFPVKRGDVFLRADRHWWVVVDVLGQRVRWVPLSSVKDHLGPMEMLGRFNVGRKNRYIPAIKDSVPRCAYAELTTVDVIRSESPERQGHLLRFVERIRRTLKTSPYTPPAVNAFSASAPTSVDDETEQRGAASKPISIALPKFSKRVRNLRRAKRGTLDK